MPQSQSTPYTAEVAYRGVRKTFEFGFYADDAQTIPIIPFNTAEYPKVQLVAPDGQVFLTRGPPSVRSTGVPGKWAFDFDVPPDSLVTAINQAWEFAAIVADSNGIEKTYRTTFIIKDPNVVKAGNQSRMYPVVSGNDLQVIFHSPVDLYSVSLRVFRSGSETDIIVDSTSVGSGDGDIKKVVSEGVYVYYYDIPAETTANISLGDLDEGIWQIHWKAQESQISPKDLVYQIAQVFSSNILEYTPHVRYIVDKLEKRYTTRQGYDESDILGALDMGLQLVNTTFPATQYVLTPGTGTSPTIFAGGTGVVPDQFKPYVILGAAWWLYMGQLGLAVDLQFSFSGQRTTLDQDQTGGIESLLDKYRSALEEQLGKVKTDFLRQNRRVGTLAVRPRSYRVSQTTVFKINSTLGSNYIGFLNGIGLI